MSSVNASANALGSPSSSALLFFLPSCLYEALTLPLYLRILYVFIVSPKFSSNPFYRLLIVNGFSV
jgi:hypothetical protein